MQYDFNKLEGKARQLRTDGCFAEALRIYYFMADGDPSLDGGYLGKVMGECYESLGEFQAAKYWYSRAVEENPEVRKDCAEAIERLSRSYSEDFLR